MEINFRREDKKRNRINICCNSLYFSLHNRMIMPNNGTSTTENVMKIYIIMIKIKYSY